MGGGGGGFAFKGKLFFVVATFIGFGGLRVLLFPLHDLSGKFLGFFLGSRALLNSNSVYLALSLRRFFGDYF